MIGSRGRVEIDPRDAMNRDTSILGMLLWNTPKHDASSIHSALAAGLENGTLHPAIGKEMPLADAPRRPPSRNATRSLREDSFDSMNHAAIFYAP